ncbi:MAG: DsbA family protein [Candidatus Binataceae bacterium]
MRTYFAPRLVLPVSARDHIRGPAAAPVTIVEYGDYECPYCGTASAVVDDLRSEAGDSLRFVFRNFPMTEVHPHAEHAAEIAEAAAMHDKFWEMHDMLYAHQDALDDQHLAEYAVALGLPTSDLRALAKNAYLPRVREDFLSGVRSGVNGTPTFFINGVRHDGSYDLEALRDAVSKAA